MKMDKAQMMADARDFMARRRAQKVSEIVRRNAHNVAQTLMPIHIAIWSDGCEDFESAPAMLNAAPTKEHAKALVDLARASVREYTLHLLPEAQGVQRVWLRKLQIPDNLPTSQTVMSEFSRAQTDFQTVAELAANFFEYMGNIAYHPNFADLSKIRVETLEDES